MSSQSVIDLLVTLDPSRLDRFDEIASDLEQMGGAIRLRLSDPGLLGVRIDRSCVDQIRQLDGVLHVEESRRLYLQD